jgi:adenylate kinase family enzyme
MKKKVMKNSIFEGRYDPHIRKAFFLIGSPGSGKTFVRKKIFPYGVKPVDIDIIFEHLVKIKKNVKEMKNIDYKSPEYNEIYQRAKELIEKLLNLYAKNNLGIVLDGTGRNVSLIRSTKEMLEKLGYKTYLVYVFTTLDVAMQRNQQRDRSIRPDILKSIYESVIRSISDYVKLFGKENILVINNNNSEEVDWQKYIKTINKWLSS